MRSSRVPPPSRRVEPTEARIQRSWTFAGIESQDAVSPFGSSATRTLAPVLPDGATTLGILATSANVGWGQIVPGSRREYLQGMTADELFLLTFEDLEER